MFGKRLNEFENFVKIEENIKQSVSESYSLFSYVITLFFPDFSFYGIILNMIEFQFIYVIRS